MGGWVFSILGVFISGFGAGLTVSRCCAISLPRWSGFVFCMIGVALTSIPLICGKG